MSELEIKPNPTEPSSVPAPRVRQRYVLHLFLFVATFFSCMLSQTLFASEATTFRDALQQMLANPEKMQSGFVFALTLMSILLAHEMGHYITARIHGVDQSLPFFIPAPTLVGTLGAVILMRSQPPTRGALLRVAVMGPYAGLVLAIPAAAWGLAHSIPVDPTTMEGSGTVIWFGSSLLFRALESLFSPNGTDVILHPVGYAGWVGMFITSLNLLPAAQLDGGHVSYALFGKNHEQLSLAVAMALFTTGLFLGLGMGGTGSEQTGVMWIIWAVLLFFLGLKHPQVRHEEHPLSGRDRFHGWVALILFALTFMPVPLRFVTIENAAPASHEDVPNNTHEEQPEEFKL